MNTPKIFEVLRYLGIMLGLFLGFYCDNPLLQLKALAICIVLSVIGLTGIEDLFFGKAASEAVGYNYAPEYQKESVINNLAIAITLIIAWLCDWKLYSYITLLSITLALLLLSGLNRLWLYINGNRNLKNLLRLVMAIILLAICIPFIYRAISYEQKLLKTSIELIQQQSNR